MKATRHLIVSAFAGAATPGQTSTPSRVSFEAWVEAVIQGDSSAFGQFYDACTARLYRLSLILTHGNEDLAKELHQTTMIKAAQHFKRFREEREIWPWLAQIARHCYVDHLRKQSRFERLRSVLRIDSDVGKPEDGDEEAIYGCLESAVGELDAEDSALLNQFYSGNRTQNKIALDLSKTPKAIERQLCRIRQKLRVLLLKELENERTKPKA